MQACQCRRQVDRVWDIRIEDNRAPDLIAILLKQRPRIAGDLRRDAEGFQPFEIGGVGAPVEVQARLLAIDDSLQRNQQPLLIAIECGEIDRIQVEGLGKDGKRSIRRPIELRAWDIAIWQCQSRDVHGACTGGKSAQCKKCSTRDRHNISFCNGRPVHRENAF
jgi:hypothetical protein